MLRGASVASTCRRSVTFWARAARAQSRNAATATVKFRFIIESSYANQAGPYPQENLLWYLVASRLARGEFALPKEVSQLAHTDRKTHAGRGRGKQAQADR